MNENLYEYVLAYPIQLIDDSFRGIVDFGLKISVTKAYDQINDKNMWDFEIKA